MKEAEEADPVSDRNDDNIRVLFHEIMAIILRIRCSAHLESAAKNPHNNGLLFSRRIVSLPDVQVQAVLARTIFGSRVTRRLDGSFSIVICLVDTVVWNNVHRCFPAQISDGLPPDKRDAFICNDVLRLFANEGTVNTLGGQQMVVIAVRDSFVPTLLSILFFLSLIRKILFLLIHSFALLLA